MAKPGFRFNEAGKRSRGILALSVIALFLGSCSTSASVPERKITSEEADAILGEGEVRAQLSSQESVDGGILIASVTLPEDGRILAGADQGAPVAEYEGRQVPFYPAPERGKGNWEAVLGVPFNKNPGSDRIVVWLGAPGQGPKLELPFRIVPGNYRSEVLRVAEKHVNPNPRDLARIKREGAEVRLTYERFTRKKYWQGPFLLPIESPVTSPFGTKRLYNGEMKSFHTGMDLKAPTGTPIYSAAGGEVVMAKSLFLTGNTVILDHGYGVFTVYAHMSKLSVKKGQIIPPRELLGLSGMTGRSSGPHLHWGAVVQRFKVDPIYLTRLMR